MVAKRKVHRNQRDKIKTGGGPRTPAGKQRSRSNARKHGLNVPITADRHLNKPLYELAHFIAGEGASDAILGQALIVAECELTLRRIQRTRVTVIDSATASQEENKQHGIHETAEAFAKSLPTLFKTERYERRIQSRGKKARQNLEALQVIARLND